MNESAVVKTERIEPDITVVVLAGKLVMGRDALDLENRVAELVGKGERKIIFDLTRIYYIDSSGLGAIARCLAILRREGGDLRLAGAADKVAALFRTTRLDAVLSFYADVSEASRDFRLLPPERRPTGW